MAPPGNDKGWGTTRGGGVPESLNECPARHFCTKYPDFSPSFTLPKEAPQAEQNQPKAFPDRAHCTSQICEFHLLAQHM